MNPDFESKEKFLAEELAERLDEEGSIELYRSYVATFPEDLLRKVLAEVLAVPAEKIRKSRGALFSYLIKKYAKRANNHWD